MKTCGDCRYRTVNGMCVGGPPTPCLVGRKPARSRKVLSHHTRKQMEQQLLFEPVRGGPVAAQAPACALFRRLWFWQKPLGFGMERKAKDDGRREE
jgi:hypothetical protein